MLEVKVRTVCPSKLVEKPGAVDAQVVIEGVEYGVTLLPRESDGELDCWGDLDHWLSGPEVYTNRKVAKEKADRIIEAVRQAVDDTYPFGMFYHSA